MQIDICELIAWVPRKVEYCLALLTMIKQNLKYMVIRFFTDIEREGM